MKTNKEIILDLLDKAKMSRAEDYGFNFFRLVNNKFYMFEFRRDGVSAPEEYFHDMFRLILKCYVYHKDFHETLKICMEEEDPSGNNVNNLLHLFNKFICAVEELAKHLP